jgi:hypothetical protein
LSGDDAYVSTDGACLSTDDARRWGGGACTQADCAAPSGDGGAEAAGRGEPSVDAASVRLGVGGRCAERATACVDDANQRADQLNEGGVGRIQRADVAEKYADDGDGEAAVGMTRGGVANKWADVAATGGGVANTRADGENEVVGWTKECAVLLNQRFGDAW